MRRELETDRPVDLLNAERRRGALEQAKLAADRLADHARSTRAAIVSRSSARRLARGLFRHSLRIVPTLALPGLRDQ